MFGHDMCYQTPMPLTFVNLFFRLTDSIGVVIGLMNLISLLFSTYYILIKIRFVKVCWIVVFRVFGTILHNDYFTGIGLLYLINFAIVRFLGQNSTYLVI